MTPLDSLLALVNQRTPFFIDSRKAVEGGIFFALGGEKVDGHTFLPDVAAKGAKGAVVGLGYSGPDFGLTLYRCEDVKGALQELAYRVRESRLHQFVIGVTGSVGKTTTKEFIAHLLKTTYRVDWTKHSENSQLTLPLTIINSDPKAEVLVLEMGMSQMGELEILAHIAQPDLAVVTKIAYVHSEFFASIDEIAQAKGEILASKRTKTAIFNDQVTQFAPFKRKDLEVIVYSLEDKLPPFPLQFSATHLVENFHGAVAVARKLSVSDEAIRLAALTLTPPAKRFERVVKQGITFINDAYNASSVSVCAALKNLPKPKEGGRTIAVLSEMKELGKMAKSAHKEVSLLAKSTVDELFTLSQGAFEGEGRHYRSKDELLKALKGLAKEGDVVLLKGANSFKLWTLLEEF